MRSFLKQMFEYAPSSPATGRPGAIRAAVLGERYLIFPVAWKCVSGGAPVRQALELGRKGKRENIITRHAFGVLRISPETVEPSLPNTTAPLRD
jgi:hypothetical protein